MSLPVTVTQYTDFSRPSLGQHVVTSVTSPGAAFQGDGIIPPFFYVWRHFSPTTLQIEHQALTQKGVLVCYRTTEPPLLVIAQHHFWGGYYGVI